MRIQIKREAVTFDLLDEIEPLLKQHQREVGLPFKLSINKLLYLKESAFQKYCIYVARDRKGKIRGYIGYWTSLHPHYSVHTAQQDILYIDRKYRNTLLVMRLLKYSERNLKDEFEVQFMIQYSSSIKDISPLFRRAGYKEGNSIYLKEV